MKYSERMKQLGYAKYTGLFTEQLRHMDDTAEHDMWNDGKIVALSMIEKALQSKLNFTPKEHITFVLKVISLQIEETKKESEEL